MDIFQCKKRKAPNSRYFVVPDYWVVIDLLIQYFHEKKCIQVTVLPDHFSCLALKRNNDIGSDNADSGYIYLDSITGKYNQKYAINGSESVEVEEYEYYILET